MLYLLKLFVDIYGNISIKIRGFWILKSIVYGETNTVNEQPHKGNMNVSESDSGDMCTNARRIIKWSPFLVLLPLYNIQPHRDFPANKLKPLSRAWRPDALIILLIWLFLYAVYIKSKCRTNSSWLKMSSGALSLIVKRLITSILGIHLPPFFCSFTVVGWFQDPQDSAIRGRDLISTRTPAAKGWPWNITRLCCSFINQAQDVPYPHNARFPFEPIN